MMMPEGTVTSSKTATTALSENSRYKNPTDSIKIKKLISSDAKSINISKLIDDANSGYGNQSASKADNQFKRFDRIDDQSVLDL